MYDKELRVIIAGSRDFTNYDFLSNQVHLILNAYKATNDNLNITIISGNARGVDQMGERFAKNNNLNLKMFPANWDKYGKSAGYLRNEEMLNYAMNESYPILIVFWDGISKGTKHMIDIADKKQVPIYKFDIITR